MPFNGVMVLEKHWHWSRAKEATLIQISMSCVNVVWYYCVNSASETVTLTSILVQHMTLNFTGSMFPHSHPSAKFCPNLSSFQWDMSENVFQTRGQKNGYNATVTDNEYTETEWSGLIKTSKYKVDLTQCEQRLLGGSAVNCSADDTYCSQHTQTTYSTLYCRTSAPHLTHSRPTFLSPTD